MPLWLNDHSEPRHPQGRFELASHAQKDIRCQPDERIMGSMGEGHICSLALGSRGLAAELLVEDA